MKRKIFHSCLAQHMEQFVALRHIEGKVYRSQTWNLIYFDRFLVREKWKGRWISREIVDDYLLSQNHLAVITRRTTMSTVRQFCRYMSQFEPRCYVPDSLWTGGEENAHIPFVFTESQVCSLLARAGELQPKPSCIRPYTYQTLFGLLYTTGIRISEALALNVGDIDLKSPRLLIRNGKFGKARWIPLSPSTASKLEKYLYRRQKALPCSMEAPLFISWKSRRLSYTTAGNNFRLILRACGIPKQGRTGPTIHSLRHTFACHRLLQWYRDGLDINARLPALGTYMGHVDTRYTSRYLHATPELLEEVNQRFLNHYRENIKNGGRS